jgi:hypothetical protein
VLATWARQVLFTGLGKYAFDGQKGMILYKKRYTVVCQLSTRQKKGD